MLVNISTGPKKDAPRGRPADLLLDCHERIRRFSALAVKLATAPSAAPEEVAEVASRVHRYFTVALPLHVADEDLSLKPRVLAAHPPAELVDAIGAMSREHVEIEDLLAECAGAWETLKVDPSRRVVLAGELASASTHLEQLFHRHLENEEQRILPALDQVLPPDVQDAIVAELRARREPRA